VIEDGKQISQVAEQYNLHPNNIFNWREQLFEERIQTFQIKALQSFLIPPPLTGLTYSVKQTLTKLQKTKNYIDIAPRLQAHG